MTTLEPSPTDRALMIWINDSQERADRVGFHMGFVDGLRVALKHPEWARAFEALSHLPQEEADAVADDIVESVPLAIQDGGLEV